MNAAEAAMSTGAGAVAEVGAEVGVGTGAGAAAGRAAIEQLTGTMQHMTADAAAGTLTGTGIGTQVGAGAAAAVQRTRMGTLDLIPGTAAEMLMGRPGTADSLRRVGAAGDTGAAVGTDRVVQQGAGAREQQQQQMGIGVETGRRSSSSSILPPVQRCCVMSSVVCWQACGRLSVSCSRPRALLCTLLLTGGSWTGPGGGRGRPSSRRRRSW